MFGWEYTTTDKKCEKISSTEKLNVKIIALPFFESERMERFVVQPTLGFQIQSEMVMELPVEHGLLLDNLLDLAHVPFTHTFTFAKDWSVPSMMKFLTHASGLRGYKDPYQVDMEFRLPTPFYGVINSKNLYTYAYHLRKQDKVIVQNVTRFCAYSKAYSHYALRGQHFAEQVLNVYIQIVLGQQDRMINGANIRNLDVSFDNSGVRYRLRRDTAEKGAKQLPFTDSNYNHSRGDF